MKTREELNIQERHNKKGIYDFDSISHLSEYHQLRYDDSYDYDYFHRYNEDITINKLDYDLDTNRINYKPNGLDSDDLYPAMSNNRE